MSTLRQEAERLKEDFRHGGKLGRKSTERLIDLVGKLAAKCHQLEQIVAQRSA